MFLIPPEKNFGTSANKGNSVNAEKIINSAAVWHQVLLLPEVSSMAWTAHLIPLILKGV